MIFIFFNLKIHNVDFMGEILHIPDCNFRLYRKDTAIHAYFRVLTANTGFYTHPAVVTTQFNRLTLLYSLKTRISRAVLYFGIQALRGIKTAFARFKEGDFQAQRTAISGHTKRPVKKRLCAVFRLLPPVAIFAGARHA